MEAGGLQQQLENVRRGVAFLKHEHVAMVTALQAEITHLKRRCNDLTCELNSRFPERATTEEEAELAARCTAAEHLLEEQQSMVATVRGELRLGQARASALGQSLKLEERSFLEELKRRSHKITSLSRELQRQTATASALCQELHTARHQLYQQNGQSTAEPEEEDDGEDAQRQEAGAKGVEQEEDEEEEEIEDVDGPEHSVPPLSSPRPQASPADPVLRWRRRASLREERVRACVPRERVTAPQRPRSMPDPALFLVPLRYRLLRWNRPIRTRDREALEDEWEDMEGRRVRRRVDLGAGEGETAL